MVLFETLKIFVVFELMKVRLCFASRWWVLRWTSLVEDVAATSRIRVPLSGCLLLRWLSALHVCIGRHVAMLHLLTPMLLRCTALQ